VSAWQSCPGTPRAPKRASVAGPVVPVGCAVERRGRGPNRRGADLEAPQPPAAARPDPRRRPRTGSRRTERLAADALRSPCCRPDRLAPGAPAARSGKFRQAAVSWPICATSRRSAAIRPAAAARRASCASSPITSVRPCGGRWPPHAMTSVHPCGGRWSQSGALSQTTGVGTSRGRESGRGSIIILREKKE
jgi:hypothetical protein